MATGKFTAAAAKAAAPAARSPANSFRVMAKTSKRPSVDATAWQKSAARTIDPKSGVSPRIRSGKPIGKG